MDSGNDSSGSDSEVVADQFSGAVAIADNSRSGTNAEEEAASTPAGDDVTDLDPFSDLASMVAGGDAQPSSESEQEEQEDEEMTGGDAFGDLAALLG
jgi:hypothetical protein